jgi:hypothetical protein
VSYGDKQTKYICKIIDAQYTTVLPLRNTVDVCAHTFYDNELYLVLVVYPQLLQQSTPHSRALLSRSSESKCKARDSSAHCCVHVVTEQWPVVFCSVYKYLSGLSLNEHSCARGIFVESEVPTDSRILLIENYKSNAVPSNPRKRISAARWASTYFLNHTNVI